MWHPWLWTSILNTLWLLVHQQPIITLIQYLLDLFASIKSYKLEVFCAEQHQICSSSKCVHNNYHVIITTKYHSKSTLLILKQSELLSNSFSPFVKRAVTINNTLSYLNCPWPIHEHNTHIILFHWWGKVVGFLQLIIIKAVLNPLRLDAYAQQR